VSWKDAARFLASAITGDLWQDINDAILLLFLLHKLPLLGYKCVSVQNSTWILLHSHCELSAHQRAAVQQLSATVLMLISISTYTCIAQSGDFWEKNSKIASLMFSHRSYSRKTLRYSHSWTPYLIFARDSIYAKRAYAIAIPSVRLSVRLSDTRVIHAKTVVVRIVQFSSYSSPIPLVFAR